MMHSTSLRVAAFSMAAILLSASRVAGQGTSAAPLPNGPSTPSPAHERLAVFEGTWTSVDSVPSRDTCTWLAGGRRHMVCRRVTESARGAREQMMIYSYRKADSAYTVTVVLPGGQVWSYAGRPEGDRWKFYLTNSRADRALRLRQVIIAAADTLRFVEEASVDGGPWRLTDPNEDYIYVRSRE